MTFARQAAQKGSFPRRDLYAEVTGRIVSALERGVAPWVRPWSAVDATYRNGLTGRGYHGLNPLLLSIASLERGWTDARFLTYRQAQEAGGHVRKGERATTIVFWKQFLKIETDPETGERTKRVIPVLRSFAVFNVAQCDELDRARLAGSAAPIAEHERDAECERFINGTGATIRHGGARACYSPEADMIQLPPMGTFKDAGAYYSTTFHELTHWTGRDGRTPRDLSGRFGSHRYAAEELVAELGSAFLCERFRVDGTLQHPEYVANWLACLKADTRAIFTAASKARIAAEYLLSTAGYPVREEEAPEADETATTGAAA